MTPLSHPFRTVSAFLTLTSALALGACGDDAESKPAAAQVEPVASVVTEQPRTEPAMTVEELPRANEPAAANGAERAGTPVVAERKVNPAPRPAARPTPKPMQPTEP